MSPPNLVNETSTNSSLAAETPPSFVAIITFIIISSILSALIEGFLPRNFLRAFPQPIILLILYLIFGSIVGDSYAFEIDAQGIIAIFLPPLLHNEALKIKTAPFYKSLPGLLWIIGPALFIGALITSVFPYAFFSPEDQFPFYLSVVIGGMFATTGKLLRYQK